MEKMGGATRDPPFLMQNECDSSPSGHQLILMKDHFMGTATIVGNTNFLLF